MMKVLITILMAWLLAIATNSCSIDNPIDPGLSIDLPRVKFDTTEFEAGCNGATFIATSSNYQFPQLALEAIVCFEEEDYNEEMPVEYYDPLKLYISTSIDKKTCYYRCSVAQIAINKSIVEINVLPNKSISKRHIMLAMGPYSIPNDSPVLLHIIQEGNESSCF